jgi:hypothetical protein
VKLARSGVKLTPGSLRNPLIVVANYVFDTLRQDAFRIVEGQLQEALVSVLSDRAEPDAGDPDVIRRMRCTWDYRPCTPEIYKNAHLQAMLRAYLARLRNASVLVPIGGIGAMSNLAALAGGRVVLLAGDKAYNHEEELAGLRDPHVAVHGSFSFMVNFHAVRLYALARGGFSLHTPYLDGFKCSLFVLPGPAPGASAAAAPSAADLLASADVTLPASALTAFPELTYAWADLMDTFGPDNFSTLQRCVRDETPGAASVKTALATIRMSAWDADVFFKFKQELIDRTPHASDKAKADIYRDVQRVYERYYPLQPAKDIALELGRVCMGLQRYPEAIELFTASQRHCGEHHVSW